jgi:hypothetical protein
MFDKFRAYFMSLQNIWLAECFKHIIFWRNGGILMKLVCDNPYLMVCSIPLSVCLSIYPSVRPSTVHFAFWKISSKWLIECWWKLLIILGTGYYAWPFLDIGLVLMEEIQHTMYEEETNNPLQVNWQTFWHSQVVKARGFITADLQLSVKIFGTDRHSLSQNVYRELVCPKMFTESCKSAARALPYCYSWQRNRCLWCQKA